MSTGTVIKEAARDKLDENGEWVKINQLRVTEMCIYNLLYSVSFYLSLSLLQVNIFYLSCIFSVCKRDGDANKDVHSV